MATPRTPRPTARARRASLTALVTAACLGCQTYEARPLDPEGHRAAWHARSLEGDSLEALRVALEASPEAAEGDIDPGDGLELGEARRIARVLNPDLRIARLEVQEALAAAETAGLWSDPQLQFTVMRITDGIPDPWVLAPGLAFTVPLSDRLGATRDAADAGLRAGIWRAREAEWRLERDVQVAWFDWSEARVLHEESARLVEELAGLEALCVELVRAGEMSAPEAGLVGLERARRENRLRRLEAERDAAEQRLRALVGLTPGAPVELVPAFAAPVALAELRIEGDRPPVLRRLREEYDQAEHELRSAVLGQVPDLSIGPQYESDGGQRRLGLFGWWNVPLWNANRPAIARARARRELARAAYETEYERLVGRLEASRARAAGLALQRAELEAALLPRGDALRADAERLVDLGEGGATVLLQALVEARSIRLDLVAARADEARAIAELLHLVGPPPATPATNTES